MTPAAKAFVSELSFSTLSKNEVYSEIISDESWNNHVELGLWADVMIIAPATATTLSKMAHGMADNMVLATYLSAKCPVFIAPAMDLDMWIHGSTQDNIRTLQRYGNHILPVGHGELASGLVGDGRMMEPDNIFQHIDSYFEKCTELEGKQVLITAGPTHESIDPVRYIGNNSSGLMGICLAEECAMRGAEVKLVLGPSHLDTSSPNIEVTRVKTAEEMYQVSKNNFDSSDVAIWAAAVADYRPKEVHSEKVKKNGTAPNIALEKTRDIAKELGSNKRQNQVLVGFALETENALENAKGKLSSKNLDFIVLNSLRDKGAGFQVPTNKITIIAQGNKIKKFELKSKKDVAADIVDEVAELI